MKIVIDARLYGPENTGIGRYTTNLLAELQKIDRDNNYLVLLRRDYYEKLKLAENWRKVMADFPHYSLKEQLVLPKLLRSLNPDLVHFPHFNTPFFYKGNFVVTIHDMVMHKKKGKGATTLPAWKYGVKRLGYRAVFGKSVARARKIIVPSHFIKKELLGYFEGLPEDRVTVAHEGVDKNISGRNAPLPTGEYFVYVGNAYPHKNIWRAIEAIRLLNTKSKKEVKLALIGARDVFARRIEKMIKGAELEDTVLYLGYVTDEELGGWLANSAGFVFPSLYEGFGLPGLEAMAAGTVVLASDIPVFKEVYKKHAVYFNPFNFEAMELAMEEVLDMSVAKRKKIVKENRIFAKRYSWAEMAKITLEVYQEAAK